VLISAQEYIFGLNNMNADPFSPGEERKGNTELLSKAKVVISTGRYLLLIQFLISL